MRKTGPIFDIAKAKATVSKGRRSPVVQVGARRSGGDVVPNRTSPPAILLRESYRAGNKVRKRTLLNLSDWPRDLVAGFRALLKGGSVIPAGQDALSIIRSLPHGHVAAVLGVLRDLDLERLLARERCRERDLVVAMIVQRLIAPGSKLSATRRFAQTTLGDELTLGDPQHDVMAHLGRELVQDLGGLVV